MTVKTTNGHFFAAFVLSAIVCSAPLVLAEGEQVQMARERASEKLRQLTTAPRMQAPGPDVFAERDVPVDDSVGEDSGEGVVLSPAERRFIFESFEEVALMGNGDSAVAAAHSRLAA